jgi:hypothetical protein
MKIKDILRESSTDVVARFYKEASQSYDKFYNPEDVKYKEKNAKYYDDHFKQWFNEEVVPVFTKPVDKPQPEYNVLPKDGKLQSPGYRGLQYALAAAGLPYNHKVQRYEPNPSRMIASQTMDGARNNNGQ